MEEIKINSQFVDPYKLGMTEAEAQQVLPYMVEYTFELVKCFYENLEVRAEFFEEFQNEGARVDVKILFELLGKNITGITFGDRGSRMAAIEILEGYFTDQFDDLYGEQAKKIAERWVLSWLLIEGRGLDGINPFVDPCHKGMSEQEFETYLPDLLDYSLLIAKRLWDDAVTRDILKNHYSTRIMLDYKLELYRASGLFNQPVDNGISLCFRFGMLLVLRFMDGEITSLSDSKAKKLAEKKLREDSETKKMMEKTAGKEGSQHE